MVLWNFKLELISEQRHLLFFSLLIFLLLLLYWKIIIPFSWENIQMISSVLHFSETRVKVQQISIESERLRNKNLNILNQINQYSSQLIYRRQLAGLYKSINDAANTNRVNIIRISPAIHQDNAVSDTVKVIIHFSSGFKSIIKFIHFIEENYISGRITQFELLKKSPESLGIEGWLEFTIRTQIKDD